MSDLVGLLNLLAPFFGLIGLGFFCAKLVRRPEGGLAWMQFFLIYVSLPCLFYKLIADKPLEQLANWPFVVATTLTTYCAFALSFAVGMWHTRWDMPQGVMQGVAGSYSNIGYMGPPLVLSALGPGASAPVVLIFVFDNLLLFSLVPFLMAIAGAEKRSLAATGRDVAWKVVDPPLQHRDGGRGRCRLSALRAARRDRQDRDLAVAGGGALRALPSRASPWR